MKIVSTCGSFVNLLVEPDSKTVDIYCDAGCVFEQKGEQLLLKEYSAEVEKGQRFLFKGALYQKIKNIKNGTELIANVQNQDDKLTLPTEFLDEFDHALPTYNFDEYFLHEFDKPVEQDCMYLCKLSTGEMIPLGSNALNGKIHDDNVYFVENNNQRVLKVNFQGKNLWQFKSGYKPSYNQPFLINNPLFAGNSVIAYCGNKNVESKKGEYGPLHRPLDGVITSIDCVSGQRNWAIDLADGVFDMQTDHQSLFIISGSQLLIVDCISGEVKHKIELDTDPFYESSGFSKPSVFVDDRYIYITSPRDKRFIIVDKKTPASIRDISLPSDVKIGRYIFSNAHTGKHYFSVLTSRWDVRNFPALEVKVGSLADNAGYEPEPEHHIAIREADQGREGKELVIEISNASISDVIRFGEIYIRDEANRYSYNHMGSYFVGRKFAPEPHFNGIIRLKVSNCLSDKQIAEQYLEVMQARFQKWCDKEGLYSCLDKSTFTSLLFELAPN